MITSNFRAWLREILNLTPYELWERIDAALREWK